MVSPNSARMASLGWARRRSFFFLLQNVPATLIDIDSGTGLDHEPSPTPTAASGRPRISIITHRGFKREPLRDMNFDEMFVLVQDPHLSKKNTYHRLLLYIYYIISWICVTYTWHMNNWFISQGYPWQMTSTKYWYHSDIAGIYHT